MSVYLLYRLNVINKGVFLRPVNKSTGRVAFERNEKLPGLTTGAPKISVQTLAKKLFPTECLQQSPAKARYSSALFQPGASDSYEYHSILSGWEEPPCSCSLFLYPYTNFASLVVRLVCKWNGEWARSFPQSKDSPVPGRSGSLESNCHRVLKLPGTRVITILGFQVAGVSRSESTG